MELQSSKNLYSKITNCIIQQLEKGVFPWQKQWISAGLPRNYLTGETYRGINLLFLASLEYQNNFFISEQELKELGGTVKPKEKRHYLVINWEDIEKQFEDIEFDDNLDETVDFVHPGHYYVYNIDQCEGIPAKQRYDLTDPIANCQKIIKFMPKKPEIKEGKDTYYHPIQDFISISNKERFKTEESYYVAFLHELVHCTGHSTRLWRKELFGTSPFGSSDTMEELIAEIGTNYLVSYSGFKNSYFQNNDLSIEKWIEKLRNNNLLIFFACYQAQKAVDFILQQKLDFSEAHVA